MPKTAWVKSTLEAAASAEHGQPSGLAAIAMLLFQWEAAPAVQAGLGDTMQQGSYHMQACMQLSQQAAAAPPGSGTSSSSDAW